MAGIFYLDSLTDIGGAIAVLYVLVLLVTGGGQPDSRSRILLASVTCVILTLTAFAMEHAAHLELTALLRMSVSLAANAVTTVLLLRGQSVHATLLASEARYRTIFNTLAIAIWEHDFSPVEAAIGRVRASGVTDFRRYVAENPDFVREARAMVRITDVNDTAIALMEVGTREAFFSRLSDFLPATDASFADCLVAIDERWPMFQAETTVSKASGAVVDIIVAFSLKPGVALDRVPGSILDITERKRLEGQVLRTRSELAQVQRASAVAALSASIAHEINQPLSAIQSFSDAAGRWMRRDPPVTDEVLAALNGLSDAVQHGREVVQRVRTLVGRNNAVLAPMDLNALVDDAAMLLRREAADHDARLSIRAFPSPVSVLGDAGLLKQVLTNLVTNALQAMRATPSSEREIVVTTEMSGSTALLIVADTGPGLVAAAEERAFQSFFTTKPDGMGLGLSICRAAMETHGGSIELSNGPRGAVVTLSLPRLDPIMEAHAGAVNQKNVGITPRCGVVSGSVTSSASI